MIIKITKALIMEDTRNIQALVFDKISLSFCCVLHKYLYHFGYVQENNNDTVCLEFEMKPLLFPY